MYFFQGDGVVMNVAGGFKNDLTFYYAAALGGTVTLYDGLNGMGNVLASLDLDESQDPFNVWSQVNLAFATGTVLGQSDIDWEPTKAPADVPRK